MADSGIKRQAVEAQLGLGPAMLHLDPRLPGVVVPADFAELPILRLKISHRFANPLSLSDESLRQTLSFREGPFSCIVPWQAIFAVGPEGASPSNFWAEDLPPELLNMLGYAEAVEAAASTGEELPQPTAAPAPALMAAAALIEPEEGGEAQLDLVEEDLQSEDDPPGTIRRKHLRLVKS